MPHADRSGSFRRHSPIVRGSSRSIRRSLPAADAVAGRTVERVPQPLLQRPPRVLFALMLREVLVDELAERGDLARRPAAHVAVAESVDTVEHL